MSNHDHNWPIKTIDTWEQFEEAIANKTNRKWLFRGHSNVLWNLESSLYRLFVDMQAIFKASKGKYKRFLKDEHERELINQFKSHAHLFLDTLPGKTNSITENTDLEWLSLMQHYGTPTRLLDMTFSPYIAAFFALEAGHDDCCIFALEHRSFTEMNEKYFNSKNYKDKVFEDQRDSKSFFFPYEPEMKNERLVAQQGLFLVSSTNYQTYDDIIKQYEIDDKISIKYVLSKNMRYEGLKKLKAMNINSSTLFPGIDGFCKSLKFQVLDPIQNLKRLY